MGYRSQVTILFSSATKEDLDGFLAQVKLEDGGAEWMPDRDKRTDKHLLYEWDDVKWYDSYDDVQFWTRMMKKCGESETVYCEFCRVGEEYDDIQMEYYGEVTELLVNVSRTIEVDL